MPRWMLSLMLAALAAGCAGSGGEDDSAHALPPLDEGKADNYVSTNAREFTLAGTAHAVLPDGFDIMSPAEQEAEMTRAVDRRLPEVARSIQRHIEQVVSGSNQGRGEDLTKWFTYFRRDNPGSQDPRPATDGRVAFDFEMELVGSVYLMSQLAPGTGVRTFEVEVYDWDQAVTENVTVEIRGSESRDAFPKYDELFADGVFDIAVHFGGDYNQERFDLDTASWLVDYLLEGGWENPSVGSFDELAIDSPPFTRTILVEGRQVEARVYVIHSDMVEADREELLSEAMKQSLAERDVVFYSGHAGSGAGFILDYQPRHEIPASEFTDLPLADKYQIYVLDGCMTYRTYVGDIMDNPRKTFDDLDIVTTVNTTPFAVGYQVLHEFLYWFTLTDAEGNHFPLSWMTILRGINTRTYHDVHYGVHGIDNDPKLNPHASDGIFCRPCQADADCGAGGNFCLGYPAGSACGVACTTDTACPDGYRCARLYDDPDLFYLPKQCIQRDYVCAP